MIEIVRNEDEEAAQDGLALDEALYVLSVGDIERIKLELERIRDEEKPRVCGCPEGVGNDHIDCAAVAALQYTDGVAQEKLSEKYMWAKLALIRIRNGIYGRCTGCEQRITRKRLLAVPWTPFCLVCREGFDGRQQDQRARSYRRLCRTLGAAA